MPTRTYRVNIDTRVKGARETRDAARATAGLQKHLGGLGAKMVAANLASGILARGFSLITGAIGDLLRTAANWEDWVGRNSKALDGMSDAIDGMISKLDLARTRTKLTTGDFQATERQLRAVTKAAIIHARINKTDFVPSLRAVTDAITGQRSRAFKDLGINVDFMGNAFEKASQALELLEDRFADTSIEASNTNEKIAKMESALTDSFGELSTAITQTGLYRDVIGDLAKELSAAAKGVRTFTNATGSFFDRLGQAGLAMIAAQQGIKGKALEALLAAGRGDKAAIAEILMPGPPKMELVLGRGRVTVPKASVGVGRRRPRRSRERRQGFVLKRIRAEHAARAPDPFAAAEGAEAGIAEDVEAREVARIGARQQQIGDAQQLAEKIVAIGEASRTAADPARQLREQISGAVVDMAAATDQMATMAVSGLGQLTSGLWDAVDAAIAGKQSFGQAMAAITKSVLMGIAKQSTVQAIFETAKGFAALAIFNFPSAAQHFTAAGIFGSIAVGTGLAGIGLGAATRGGSKGAGAGAASGRSRPADPGVRPGIGRDRRRGEQLRPVINLFFNNDDPAWRIHRVEALRQELAA